MVNDGTFLNSKDLPDYFFEDDLAFSNYFSNLTPNSTTTGNFGIDEAYVIAKADEGFKDTFINDNFWDERKGIPIIPPITTNEQGFRSDSWINNGEGIVTVGCSDTFGLGQFYERTWPKLVSNYLNLNTYNLAWPGASFEYCYKALKRYLPEINTKRVFILIPSVERLEFYCDNYKGSVTGYGAEDLGVYYPFLTKEQAEQLKAYYYNFHTHIRNTLVNYNRTLDAIRYVCDDQKVELHTLINPEFGSLGHRKFIYQSFKGHTKGYAGVRKDDLAIDTKHRGKIWHIMISDYFINQLPH